MNIILLHTQFHPKQSEYKSFTHRYYVKNNIVSERLIPDDLLATMLRDSQDSFLVCDTDELVVQLTVRDYATFSAVQSTEFVYRLFGLQSAIGTENLQKFENVKLSVFLPFIMRGFFSHRY